MHPGSTREHTPSRFDRLRSIAGVVSRSNLDRMLATDGWPPHRRRTESGDHPVVDQGCQRFEVLRIGRVVSQQEIAGGFVSRAPLVPQANGFPSIEPHDIGLARNLEFLLDVF